MSNISKLSTESYKGVRDFYPEDLFIQNYIFNVWRKTSEKFGYEEYNASILEPAEIYKAKSGEEIVNEQTYTFVDRGDREVTLRPEMTPTVARMVAAKEKELAFPLRWYSIPNLFRYEKPQRGRLREHWQLNVDIFGEDGIEADVEIVTIAHEIMRSFGARDEDFEIRVNNRKLWDSLFDSWGISEDQKFKLNKLKDKKEKIIPEEFEKQVKEMVPEKFNEFMSAINNANISDFPADLKTTSGYMDLFNLISLLNKQGMTNIKYSPTLTRGFDYYTDNVFEVFDTNPENKRSLFGGGRYNDLTALFGDKKISAFGFGMGDVTIKDFLEVRDLLPDYKPATDVYVNIMDKKFSENALLLAKTLRDKDINVLLSLNEKKQNKPKNGYIILIGQNEVDTGIYEIKNTLTGEKTTAQLDGVADVIEK